MKMFNFTSIKENYWLSRIPVLFPSLLSHTTKHKYETTQTEGDDVKNAKQRVSSTDLPSSNEVTHSDSIVCHSELCGHDHDDTNIDRTGGEGISVTVRQASGSRGPYSISTSSGLDSVAPIVSEDSGRRTEGGNVTAFRQTSCWRGSYSVSEPSELDSVAPIVSEDKKTGGEGVRTLVRQTDGSRGTYTTNNEAGVKELAVKGDEDAAGTNISPIVPLTSTPTVLEYSDEAVKYLAVIGNQDAASSKISSVIPICPRVPRLDSVVPIVSEQNEELGLKLAVRGDQNATGTNTAPVIPAYIPVKAPVSVSEASEEAEVKSFAVRDDQDAAGTSSAPVIPAHSPARVQSWSEFSASVTKPNALTALPSSEDAHTPNPTTPSTGSSTPDTFFDVLEVLPSPPRDDKQGIYYEVSDMLPEANEIQLENPWRLYERNCNETCCPVSKEKVGECKTREVSLFEDCDIYENKVESVPSDIYDQNGDEEFKCVADENNIDVNLAEQESKEYPTNYGVNIREKCDMECLLNSSSYTRNKSVSHIEVLNSEHRTVTNISTIISHNNQPDVKCVNSAESTKLDPAKANCYGKFQINSKEPLKTSATNLNPISVTHNDQLNTINSAERLKTSSEPESAQLYMDCKSAETHHKQRSQNCECTETLREQGSLYADPRHAGDPSLSHMCSENVTGWQCPNAWSGDARNVANDEVGQPPALVPALISSTSSQPSLTPSILSIPPFLSQFSPLSSPISTRLSPPLSSTYQEYDQSQTCVTELNTDITDHEDKWSGLQDHEDNLDGLRGISNREDNWDGLGISDHLKDSLYGRKDIADHEDSWEEVKVISNHHEDSCYGWRDVLSHERTWDDMEGDDKAVADSKGASLPPYSRKGRRQLNEFLQFQRCSGDNLSEETRKIISMLANDRACKVTRPSLGLQDRLASLAQRSAGRHTRYPKGPRVCSTLVKSIVKRTHDSLQARGNSCQFFVTACKEESVNRAFSNPAPCCGGFVRSGTVTGDRHGDLGRNLYSRVCTRRESRTKISINVKEEAKPPTLSDPRNEKYRQFSLQVPGCGSESRDLPDASQVEQTKDEIETVQETPEDDNTEIPRTYKKGSFIITTSCYSDDDLESRENTFLFDNSNNQNTNNNNNKNDDDNHHHLNTENSDLFSESNENSKAQIFFPSLSSTLSQPTRSHDVYMTNSPNNTILFSDMTQNEQGTSWNDPNETSVRNQVEQEEEKPWGMLIESPTTFASSGSTVEKEGTDRRLRVFLESAATSVSLRSHVEQEEPNKSRDVLLKSISASLRSEREEEDQIKDKSGEVSLESAAVSSSPDVKVNSEGNLGTVPTNEWVLKEDLACTRQNNSEGNKVTRKPTKIKPASYKGGSNSSNFAVDLQAHIASLNKVSRKLIGKNKEGTKGNDQVIYKLDGRKSSKARLQDEPSVDMDEGLPVFEGELESFSQESIWDKEENSPLNTLATITQEIIPTIDNDSLDKKIINVSESQVDSFDIPDEIIGAKLDTDSQDENEIINVSKSQPGSYDIPAKITGTKFDYIYQVEAENLAKIVQKDKQKESIHEKIPRKSPPKLPPSEKMTDVSILQNLLLPGPEEQPASPISRYKPSPYKDAFSKLKTDNLKARCRGTNSPLFPPYSPYPKPKPPSPLTAETKTTEKRKHVVEKSVSQSPTPDTIATKPPVPTQPRRSITDNLPPKLSSSRHGSIDIRSVKDTPKHRRQSRRDSCMSIQSNRKGSKTKPCLRSRNNSIDHGHSDRRQSIKVIHSRQGSRFSFSQDLLRKCLETAVDTYYSTDWEETVAKEHEAQNSMSQEELNKSLRKAVCYRDAEKARSVLKLGADPNMKYGHSSLLIRSAKDGSLYVLQALLAAGADTDLRTEQGNSALHLAAREGYSEVAVQLVESGAFVDAINRSGVTPLQMALAHGHLEVARHLIRMDADMLLQNKIGESAGDVASQLGYTGLSPFPREVRRESCAGTRVEEVSMEIPVAVRLIKGIEDGCPATVESCLLAGASPNTLVPLALHWPAHASVLHRAAHHGHDLIVRLLLVASANTNSMDIVGNTPLHAAAQAGHNRVVKILLENGAYLEAPSQSGMTPLHRAASKGKELTCNLLLRRGANTQAVDSEGRTPADWARKRGFKPLSKKLVYRRKSSATLLEDDNTKDCLEHLQRLHQAALRTTHTQHITEDTEE